MSVKEIFKSIMLNDNVAIIDQKNYYKYLEWWRKRYCDYEVKHIYSESSDNNDSWLVIAIIV